MSIGQPCCSFLIGDSSSAPAATGRDSLGHVLFYWLLSSLTPASSDSRDQPHLNCHSHERPAAAADVATTATRAQLIIVRHVNVNDNLSLHGLEVCSAGKQQQPTAAANWLRAQQPLPEGC
jgi:hypothetical protein